MLPKQEEDPFLQGVRLIATLTFEKVSFITDRYMYERKKGPQVESVYLVSFLGVGD